MKHNLKISVSKVPQTGGVVTCRNVNVRERFLRLLFGRKQKGIDIGGNIRRVRMEKGLGQTELVRMLQLQDIDITRETLVKIERGIQHITGSQLRGIRDCLETSYDELLK